MKSYFSLLLISILGCCNVLLGQITGNGPTLSHAASMQGPPVGPRDVNAFSNLVNINGQDGFYLKKDLYLTQSYTVINGEQVLGIPFLFMPWFSGTLTTPDGRVYNDYKLKYNAQSQIVHFLNGHDSLEVNEPVKEFTLNVAVNDTIIQERYIHSSNFKGNNPSIYYQVILDNNKGQLLKTNQKVVVSSSEGIIASSRIRKYLNLVTEYYYFDKKSNKLTKLKPSTDMRKLLNLTDEEATKLQLHNVNLANDVELISLIKKYFDAPALKAF